jgi:hypothetical protein
MATPPFELPPVLIPPLPPPLAPASGSLLMNRHQLRLKSEPLPPVKLR